MDVHISLDEKLLDEIRKIGGPRGLDTEQIIREALLGWLKQNEGRRFEQEWIAALARRPDEAIRAEEWLEVQTWTES